MQRFCVYNTKFEYSTGICTTNASNLSRLFKIYPSPVSKRMIVKPTSSVPKLKQFSKKFPDAKLDDFPVDLNGLIENNES